MIEFIVWLIVAWVLFRFLDGLFMPKPKGNRFAIRDGNGQYWIVEEREEAVEKVVEEKIAKEAPNLRIVK